jgi:predicted membrane chloride channel (bestrophin family)
MVVFTEDASMRPRLKSVSLALTQFSVGIATLLLSLSPSLLPTPHSPLPLRECSIMVFLRKRNTTAYKHVYLTNKCHVSRFNRTVTLLTDRFLSQENQANFF